MWGMTDRFGLTNTSRFARANVPKGREANAMGQIIEVSFSTPEILAIVRAAFPEAASRRTVKVEPRTRVHISDYWDGGSRAYVAFVRLADMTSVPSSALPRDACPQQGKPLSLTIAGLELAPGFAMVEHVIFRGKDLGYHVSLHPSNVTPNLLPAAPQVEERDRRILAAIRSYKSGPYRVEALAGLGFTPADRDRLAGAGFLRVSANGATAITAEGRAACANERV